MHLIIMSHESKTWKMNRAQQLPKTLCMKITKRNPTKYIDESRASKGVSKFVLWTRTYEFS